MDENGSVQEMQYLTEREKAVVNAMRKGAMVEICHFEFQTFDELEEMAKLFDGIEPTVYNGFYESDKIDAIRYWKKMKNLSVLLGIPTEREDK